MAHVEAVESRILLSAYTLSQFGAFGANATGANPQSTLVADSNGNLFGTASAGGAYGAGSVFEIAAGSGTITTLASFDYTDGANDDLGVTLDAAGNLFGATPGGGASGDGVVFEIAHGSNAITTLASFDQTSGTSPYAGVTIDASGNLYGTTAWGGPSDDGTLFEIASGSATLTTLATFAAPNGYRPDGLTIDAAGDLFGTNLLGGANNDGTVFELPAGSTTVTTVAAFNGTNGAEPGPLTLDASGDLFGTTEVEGGGIFEIAAGSGTITTLASFNSSNGSGAAAGVTVDGAGNIYGVTEYDGPANDGTVFEVAKGSNAIATVASFNGNNGEVPRGGLMFDASGNLYGTTTGGGVNAGGTVFEIAAGSSAITAVAGFDTINGTRPVSAVARDGSGDLFATSQAGGANGLGTVFEIASGSTALTTLASFDGTSGGRPYAGVTLDAAGNLFGTTEAGGAGGYGGVFEIASGSTAITTLVTFNGTNGENPYAGLTLDAAGDLFGTTRYGGASGDGTVFEIAYGSAALTTLVSFNGTNGEYPYGGLTLDAAGNLLGTTRNGGTLNDGTVFEIPRGSNAATTVATFDGTNGEWPNTTLVVDPSGNIYGTTAEELGTAAAAGVYPYTLTYPYGTVFEIAAGSATITTLASFNSSNGANPTGLTQDVSGNLYGTTSGGGAGNNGTVFEIAQGSATITTLISFNGTNGRSPDAGVALDGSGNLYGTSQFGGPSSYGTLFELRPNTAVALALTSGPNPSNTNQPLTFTATVSGGVPDGETVTLVDTSNNAVVATGTLNSGAATLPIPAGTLSVGTHNLIAAYAGDANFAASESSAYAQIVQAAPPALVGAPAINGDNPNGLFNAPGQGATPGVQRSMVEDIVYTFSEPVVINDANAAFTVALAGSQGIGTVPTTLFAQAVPGSNGTQWAVSLTGQAEGTLASIANGEYSIQINPAAVFAAVDGTTSMAPGTGRTDTFYRLFGDVQGTESVNTLDYARFKQALSTYNPIFDVDGNGSVSTLDYARFKQDLSVSFAGDGFVTSI